MFDCMSEGGFVGNWEAESRFNFGLEMLNFGLEMLNVGLEGEFTV
jgi:hypothetical protein